MTTLTTYLSDLSEKADAATKGPWGVHRFGRSVRVGLDWASSPTDITGSISATDAEATAEFIVASRAAVPALVRAVQSVLALHVQDEETGKCRECSAALYSIHSVRWPCPTVAALADALGVSE